MFKIKIPWKIKPIEEFVRIAEYYKCSTEIEEEQILEDRLYHGVPFLKSRDFIKMSELHGKYWELSKENARLKNELILRRHV